MIVVETHIRVQVYAVKSIVENHYVRASEENCFLSLYTTLYG
jgi:hypothetical protein